ncbi:MAG: hypothetical protein WCD51_13515 [Anaerolineae bacterium]
MGRDEGAINKMFHALLTRMDASAFLGFRGWDFSFRSMRERYGLTFLGQVALRHPWRTFGGILKYRKLLSQQEGHHGMTRMFEGSDAEFVRRLCEAKTGLLVAVGFCQKPRAPACPARRPNHDCVYLDNLDFQTEGRTVNPACERCDIRTLGTLALRAGACMHIMTSALDIARDVMIPSVDHGRFQNVIMCLCPYSVRVIALPLTICGLEGYLVGYESGACANWDQWFLADRGIKHEMTMLGSTSHASVVSALEMIAHARAMEGLSFASFRRESNIYEPVLR